MHDALLEAWWNRPDDETLQVLADAWLENGEPRGLFVRLSLLTRRTREQEKQYQALLAKKDELVGPARPFLRAFEFGANGLVARARCEADKLAAGIEEIGHLNPKLCLCITALKKPSTMAAVATISLERIHYVTFTMGLVGPLGGVNLTDDALVGIAPAFRGVKNLGLQARGFAPDCFSPSGLSTFADSLDGLEYFALDYFTTNQRPDRTPLPPVSDYVDVVTSHRAFKSLKAVIINGADEAALRTLPNVVTVKTDGLDDFPKSAEELAALKSR